MVECGNGRYSKGIEVEWQLPLTTIAVALAGIYVLRALIRPLLGRGCGSGCGKCAAPESPSPPGRIALPQIRSKG
jgi:hypothetical protein